MVEEEHPAFPYTDAFRKAKRNSLIWSGVTIAAALGSPPVVGGEATLGQLGLSLTYDKSVLIGISGTVAIFMAIGFYQAYQRIKLHASQLFAGKSDVAEIFGGLSHRARNAVLEIDHIVMTFEKSIREDASSILDDVCNTFDQISQIQREEILLNQKITDDSKERTKFSDLNDQQLIRALPEIRTHLTQRAGRISGLERMVGNAKQRLEHLKVEIRRAVAIAASEKKQDVEERVHALASTVNTLTRFHEGIYRSERTWFFAYDVAPVIALFLVAMIPFARLFAT